MLLVILALCFATSITNGQNTCSTCGGNGIGNGGTFSYTIGQLAYTLKGDANLSIMEGVQQPFEILIISGIENPEIELEMLVYPNPVLEKLKLQVNASELGHSKFIYQLYNLSGTLVKENEISSSLTTIDMSGLIASTYFLKVVKEKEALKAYKIIKY